MKILIKLLKAVFLRTLLEALAGLFALSKPGLGRETSVLEICVLLICLTSRMLPMLRATVCSALSLEISSGPVATLWRNVARE